MSDFGELDISKIQPLKDNPVDSSRRKLLQVKQNTGQITPEENAELAGLYAFPDNTRGQELRKKDALGVITDDEQKELAKLYQLKSFSPEMIDLIRREESGDSNVTLVNMNGGKAITVTNQEHVLFTYGLNDCTAMLIYGEQRDGSRIGIETHYLPTDISGNLGMIKDLSVKTGISKATRKVAFIVSPGHYVQNPQTEQWSQEVKDKHILQVLTTAIQADIGEDTQIRVLPYDETHMAGRKDEGIAILRIPQSGNTTYRTTNTSGIV